MSEARKLFDQYVPNKRAFYDLLIRKRKYLPDFEYNIITIEFLHQIFNGELPVPTQDEVSCITLATPPNKRELKKILLGELSKIMMKDGIIELMDLIREKEVNVEWMIRFTFLLNKEHFIFHEGYKPVQQKKVVEAAVDPHAVKFEKYNAEAFANVPVPDRNQMKKKCVVSGMIAREKKPTKL